MGNINLVITGIIGMTGNLMVIILTPWLHRRKYLLFMKYQITTGKASDLMIVIIVR